MFCIIALGCSVLALFLFVAGYHFWFRGKDFLYQSQWQKIPIETSSSIYQLWGLSKNNLWAVGQDGLIAHWNGKSWQVTKPITDLDLYDIWGCAENDVWAVGGGKFHAYPRDVYEFQSVTLHFDGKQWQRIKTPFDDKQALNHIWGQSCESIWSGGDTRHTKAVLHYNGQAWQEVEVDPHMGLVQAITGNPDDEISVLDFGFLYSWQNEKFVRQEHLGQGRYNGTFSSMIQTAETWPPHHLVVSTGIVLDHYGTLEIWDGEKWTETICNLPLIEIWGKSHQDFWGFDDAMAQHLYHVQNGKCTKQGHPQMTARTIWGFEDELWLAGVKGMVMRMNLSH